jgi:hypothetical protein
MVWYVLLRPLRPELDGQDPFQISGLLCQTRKTPTLGNLQKKSISNFNQGTFKVLNIYSNVRGGGNCEAISDGAGVSL